MNNIQVKLPAEDTDCTSDLSQWFHCANNKGLPDTVLSQAWEVVKSVSFVFHHRSAAAEVDSQKQMEPQEEEEEEVKSKRYRRDDEADGELEDEDSDEDFVL